MPNQNISSYLQAHAVLMVMKNNHEVTDTHLKARVAIKRRHIKEYVDATNNERQRNQFLFNNFS